MEEIKTTKRIENESFDEERALYNLTDTEVCQCTFAGLADGESALKEARGVILRDCIFSLRYPLWHTEGFELHNCTMNVLTRAPLWYSAHGRICDSNVNGVKALRECSDIELFKVKASSAEFGWRCRDLSISRSKITSEYFLFECKRIKLDRVKLKGKYSFQYVEDAEICDSVLDTKDAFWHCKNVTVRNSTVKGEYLGWYSDGLTLVDCHIIGTQPLCYCKNLTLENCTMEDTDLSFEYSDVQATVNGAILSVKNPRSGSITADSYGEIVLSDSVMETTCEIKTR